ncbi:hypothetical protein C8R47DRAFT_962393 [Mycena vitilis]|nr:hypothetical protein C8R47DRAFT_962393 [Mycena vitilis]
MLRSNEATELCLTKGQEGVVVGWDSSTGPADQNILETLFVKLNDPPREVQIGDLPVNVVPVPRTVTHLTCLLPDDSLLSILREQVVVLLNFGMTDFTAQGKSRDKNLVELSNCNDHRSVYVALSRGRTASGTIILQNFDTKKITSGMQGALRQELRELEMLDEITRLRFEGKLDGSVTGIYRRGLLRSYYAWKSSYRDPAHFHPAIKWQPSMGSRVPGPIKYGQWKPSPQGGTKKRVLDVDVKAVCESPKKKSKTAHASSSKCEQPNVPVNRSSLSKPNTNVSVEGPASGHNRTFTFRPTEPVGFIWNSVDHSCGYDSLFTVLVNIWADDPVRRGVEFSEHGQGMALLSRQFELSGNGHQSWEMSRNSVRAHLHSLSPVYFPYGPRTTSIDKIAEYMFPTRSYGIGRQTCSTCTYRDPTDFEVLETFLSAGLSRSAILGEPVPISKWLANYLRRHRTVCHVCTAASRRSRVFMTTVIHTAPSLLLLFLDSDRLTFDRVLKIESAGDSKELTLRGVIYGGFGHFTCRVVDKDGWVWFNDGITTGRRCVREFKYDAVDNLLDLHGCRGRKALAVIYAGT